MRERCDEECAGGELDERRHPHEGPVRVFEAVGIEVDALECGDGHGQRDVGGREAVLGGGHARGFGERVVAAPCKFVDDLDLDGGLGAGVDAGGFEALGEAAVAHVALADNAAFGVELRDGVGAVPDAILAADAGVGRVQNDAGDGVFGVGVDRAALDALGREAMVAAHGEIVAGNVGVGAAFDLAYSSPPQVRRRIVLFVAGDLAGAAADALGHVEVEAVLLADLEGAIGNEARPNFDDWQGGTLDEFETVFRQTNDVVRCVGVREFVEWERHGVWLFAVGVCKGEALVDVAVVAMVVLELLDVFGGGIFGEGAVPLDEGVEGGVDVLGHAAGVAAYVDAGALLEPTRRTPRLARPCGPARRSFVPDRGRRRARAW